MSYLPDYRQNAERHIILHDILEQNILANCYKIRNAILRLYKGNIKAILRIKSIIAIIALKG